MRRYDDTMSIPQETINTIWNRAAEADSPAELAAAGDRALHLLLLFHGLVSNGGLYYAVELHRADENYPIDEIAEAYRFFELERAADAIERAVTEQEELEADESDDVDDDTVDEASTRIDDMYHLEDTDLEEHLVFMLQRDPEAFAPVA